MTTTVSADVRPHVCTLTRPEHVEVQQSQTSWVRFDGEQSTGWGLCVADVRSKGNVPGPAMDDAFTHSSFGGVCPSAVGMTLVHPSITTIATSHRTAQHGRGEKRRGMMRRVVGITPGNAVERDVVLIVSETAQRRFGFTQAWTVR